MEWARIESGWLTSHYLRGVIQTPSTINTSFPLTFINANNTQEIRIVNTRTMDMEFSTSSNLAIACNCIKGGFLSIIQASSLVSNEPDIRPIYNENSMHSCQVSFKVNKGQYVNT